MLSDNYDLVSVDISNFNPVPQDIDVLMIIAPKKSLPETHKFIIDQFIMRGGNVAWLINKIVPDFQQQIIVGDILNIDLDDLLANYGIVINPDLIKDIQCSQVQIQSQDGIPIALNYPYFPNITNIDKENPVFNSIQSVVLQFVSSINIDAAQNKGITAKPLLITSDKSGKTEGFFILNLEQFQNLTKRASDTLFSHNGFVVGATCTGKFTSFYAGKMIPMDTSRNSSSYTKETLDASLKESKMVVIGDGDFANEESKPPKDNLNFFCNLIEYLAIDINLYEQKK
jgi:ABC-2 type transport system permease protein